MSIINVSIFLKAKQNKQWHFWDWKVNLYTYVKMIQEPGIRGLQTHRGFDFQTLPKFSHLKNGIIVPAYFIWQRWMNGMQCLSITWIKCKLFWNRLSTSRNSQRKLEKWPKLATETDFLGTRICHFYDQEHDKTQGQLSARVVYQLLWRGCC